MRLMDQEERGDRMETSKNSTQIAQNPKNSNNGNLSDTVAVKISEENAGLGLCMHQEMSCVIEIGTDSSQNNRSTRKPSSLIEQNVKNGVVPSEGFVEATEEINEARGVDETLDQVDRKSDNVKGTSSSKVLAERPARKDPCIIDVNGSVGGKRRFNESYDGEKNCRICHLSSEHTDLIHLGCRCKDELGIAHRHCAEAWFKLKGNRMCEICGQSAKNVTGIRDDRYIEDWHDRGSTSVGFSSSDQGAGCWRGQPLCNFLMACLVLAFVLPWFFHADVF